jgi:hypothetical protein
METQQIERITPIMADAYLKLNTRNRKVSKASVAFLVNEIRKGNWEFNGCPIIFGDSGLLLDGQHRLLAISQTGTSKKFSVVRGVKDSAFKTIDSGRARTGADALSVENVPYATTVATAIKKIMNKYYSTRTIVNGTTVKTSTSDVYNFYFQNKEKLTNLLILANRWWDKGGRVVHKTDVVAMLWLLNEEDERAFAFIEEVATGSYEGLINKTAQTLRNRLIRAKFEMGTLSEGEKRDLYLVAFRHYLNGVEISKLMVRTQQKFKQQEK